MHVIQAPGRQKELDIDFEFVLTVPPPFASSRSRGSVIGWCSNRSAGTRNLFMLETHLYVTFVLFFFFAARLTTTTTTTTTLELCLARVKLSNLMTLHLQYDNARRSATKFESRRFRF